MPEGTRLTGDSFLVFTKNKYFRHTSNFDASILEYSHGINLVLHQIVNDRQLINRGNAKAFNINTGIAKHFTY